jgi:hypothetical protein
MDIDQTRLALSTGANTSASAAARVDTNGELEGIHLSWDTAVVTKTVSIGVYTQGLNGPVETIFSANVASTASGWYYPRKAVHTSAGAAALFAAGGTPLLEKFAIADNLVFSVGGSDTGLTGSPYKLTAYWRK